MNVAGGQTPAPAKEQVAFEHSSWIMYANYDQTTLRLEIGFKDGSIVQHWPIYPQTWIDFKLAPSKGSYYYHAIKKTNPAIPVKK